MRNLLISCFAVFLAWPAFAENVVLLNGTIIDGSGKARVQGNLRIRDGRITDIGAFRPAAGEATIDVKGMVIAPGFIDLQSGPGTDLKNDRSAAAQIPQGITTVVLGTDGNGPIAIEDFMTPFDQEPPAINILTMVGHGTVRRSVLRENFKRAATGEELLRMQDLVEYAMREGAFGLSSSLKVEAVMHATADEYMALATTAARYGGLVSLRLGDDKTNALPIVQQTIDVGRTAKTPIQISHLTPDSPAAIFDAIEKARTQRIDVMADTDLDASAPGTGDLRAFFRREWISVADAASRIFTSLLGTFVRDQKLLTLEQAVRKMSGLPAARIGLKGRGVLAKGAPADVVAFLPAADPVGMKYVFVNGVMVLNNGELTDARPGSPLR